jgi:hypothetical protein
VPAAPNPLVVAIALFGLTLFLDLLDLSFARAVFFMRTLRFWLYFLLHFGISALAAYLLRSQLPEWYLLAPAAAFLGVGVLSNTNVKLAGYSLVPIADLFVGIRAKMFDQASEEKLAQVTRAEEFERMYTLPVERVEVAHRAGLAGAGWSETNIQNSVIQARGSGDYKSALITQVVRVNLPYVLSKLKAWETSP